MRQEIVSPQMLGRISRFTLELKLHNFIQALERRYNPNWPAQPRIPGGEPIGPGQWTSGAGLGLGPQRPPDRSVRVAAGILTLFGTLKQKVSAPGVGLVLCIYDFGDGLYSLPSDPAMGCSPLIHQSAVVPIAHGQGGRLNDN